MSHDLPYSVVDMGGRSIRRVSHWAAHHAGRRWWDQVPGDREDAAMGSRQWVLCSGRAIQSSSISRLAGVDTERARVASLLLLWRRTDATHRRWSGGKSTRCL